jgi:hypothetical protein
MSERLPFVIHRFFTKYDDDPKNPGKQRALDMVEYGPLGSGDRTKCVARIDMLSRIDTKAGVNPATQQAKMTWDFIKPHYEAWKNNQALPDTGTPLAAWNHLTPEQAEVLRVHGIRSVEDVSMLTDTHIQRIPIPSMRTVIEAAKRFLTALDANRASSTINAIEESNKTLMQQNADLVQRVNELAEMVAAGRRKPGRPRKVAEEQTAA